MVSGSTRTFDVILAYPRERVSAFYPMIPLGLANIAAVLEQNNVSVKIIDFNFYRGDFQRDLKKWNPKIIGIGGTTITRKASYSIANLAKKVFADVPVVYGGIHASFTAEDTLKNIKEIDFIVKGEGEYTFLSLCEFFSGRDGDSIHDLPGLSYRNNNGYIHNKAERIDDLDELPLPARHLFNNQYKMKLDFVDSEADFLMTSRGCPHACTFCSASRMFPGGLRCRSAENVQSEVEYVLSQKNIKALKLFDSTFTASREHVLDFCKMIKPYNLLWECEVRADTVDYELLRIMKEAGCCYIDVGLETTDMELLKKINKRIHPKQVENILDWCRKLDIKTKVFFIFGILGQTYESCLRDIDYIKNNENKIDFYSTTIGMRVYPGTAIERKARQLNLMPQDFSWANYKSPKWNYLIYEFEDILILNQKQLNYFKLFKIFLILLWRRHLASFGFIKDILILNSRRLFTGLWIKFKYLIFGIRRKAESIFEKN